MEVRTITRTLVRGGSAALVVVLAGCGAAKKADVDDQFAQLRREMQEADAALAARMDRAEARLTALENDLEKMRHEFGVAIRRLEGLLVFDVPVHFDFDSFEIRPQDRPVLDRFAAVVRSYYPTALITVEGFTDPAGSAAYNLRLGKARADAVKNYLVEVGGLPAERIRAVSYGEAEDRQVVKGATKQDGYANRRVTLVVDYFAGQNATVADAVE